MEGFRVSKMFWRSAGGEVGATCRQRAAVGLTRQNSDTKFSGRFLGNGPLMAGDGPIMPGDDQ